MNDELRRGLEMINSADYYEAHEVLEDVWRSSPPESKLFVQALVQVAVCMHHQSTGNFRGARSVLARAMRNLSDFPSDFHSIDVAALRLQLEHWAAALASDQREKPLRVQWQPAA